MRTLTILVFFLPILCSAQPVFEFKGLRLGMSLSELNSLMRSTPWGREHGDNRDEPFERSPYSTTLTADTYNTLEEPPPQHPFHKWVCFDNDCLFWDYVDFGMPEDTVTHITILSQPVYEENLIDLVRCAKEILPTLVAQMGKPVRSVGNSLRQLSKEVSKLKLMSDWKSVSLVEWRWKYSGGNTHTLGRAKLKVLKSSDRKYHLEVICSDFSSRLIY